jgi:hypothetical protein
MNFHYCAFQKDNVCFVVNNILMFDVTQLLWVGQSFNSRVIAFVFPLGLFEEDAMSLFYNTIYGGLAL